MDLYTKGGDRVDMINVDVEVEFYDLTAASEFAKILEKASLEVSNVTRDKFISGAWKVVFEAEGSINFPILEERW